MITIIAEIGVNWMEWEHAKLMISLAKTYGADAAKFQYFREIDIKDHPRFNELVPMVLDIQKARELIDYGKSKGITVFFTPENEECVPYLEAAGNPVYKIGHNNYKNKKLWEAVASTGKSIICSVPEGNNSPKKLAKKYNCMDRTKFLFCNTSYPTEDENVHMPHFISFDGFSDHTRGFIAALTAAARGAEAIEVHFKTLSNCIDAEVSKSTEELEALIGHIRRIEKMVG